MKKLLTLLCLCFLCIGSAWGEATKVAAGDLVSGQKYIIVATYDNNDYLLEPKIFSAKNSSAVIFNESNVTEDDAWVFTQSGDKWTIKLSSGEGLYFTNDNNGVACATNKGASFTISATAENETTCYLTASDGTNTRYLALYQGSNWRCYKNTSSGVPQIQLYSIAQDERTPINMTGFTAEYTTLIKGNTTTTSVTNDQQDWTAAYTYSSNKESVATVDADGTITAVGKGEATITATLNVASDDATYKVGTTKSMDITITVNNPSHTASFSINGAVNTDYNQSVEEGSSITFPTNPSVADVEFIGWVKEAITGTQDDKPTLVNTSTETMGEADVTYYAVFATAEIGNEYTQITSTNALEAGGRYLIVGNSSSNYKALPVDKAEALTTVSPSSSKITDPAAELIWTLEVTPGM